MLIGGHPVHYTYEGDEQEAARWLPLGQRVLEVCINNNMPARNITPTPDVEIRCEWMGGIGKLHIKAGGSSGGFFMRPVSDETNIGFGEPLTQGNAPWGTALPPGHESEITSVQRAIIRSALNPADAQGKVTTKTWKPVHPKAVYSGIKDKSLGIQGGSIAAQVPASMRNTAISIRGYKSGWLPRAEHGHGTYFAGDDDADTASVSYQMDAASPIFHNGNELEIIPAAGHETLIDTTKVCGVGVLKTSAGVRLVGICKIGTKTRYACFVTDTSWKTAYHTGSFEAENWINLTHFPAVWFFNESGTKASAVLHKQIVRTGDRFAATDFYYTAVSIETAVAHVQFSDGAFVSYSEEGDTPVPYEAKFESTTKDEQPWHNFDGTPGSWDAHDDFSWGATTTNTYSPVTRTIAIGYIGNEEKRLTVDFSRVTTVFDGAGLEKLGTGAIGCFAGRGTIETPSFDLVSSGKGEFTIADYDLYTVNNTTEIKYKINGTLISDCSFIGQTEYCRKDRRPFKGYAKALGGRNSKTNYTPFDPGGSPTDVGSWLSNLQAELDVYPGPGMIIRQSGGPFSPILLEGGGDLVVGYHADIYYPGGTLLYGVDDKVDTVWGHDDYTTPQYNGSYSATINFINLIAVDFVNNKLYYDILNQEINGWPTTGWRTYDDSSGIRYTRSVMCNKEVLYQVQQSG